MKIISAIYEKVRHRLNDDWAFGNGMQIFILKSTMTSELFIYDKFGIGACSNVF